MSNDEHDSPEPLLTIAEMAEELHLNPATIRLWVSKGLLPAKRAGLRTVLVRRADLDWLLSEREAIKTRRNVDALISHTDEPPELSAAGRVTGGFSAEATPEHEHM
jgi:excisionase family DNA binding protein